MRAFAIVHRDGNIDFSQSIISKLPIDSEVHVFNAASIQKLTFNGSGCKITQHDLPDAIDTIPKQKNYVIRELKKSNSQINYLSIVEESTIINDGVSLFLDDIEQMMSVFNLADWFSTICDGMNFIYEKYNPRLNIAIDDPKYMHHGLTNMIFTSHANTQWIVVDMSKVNDDYLFFCEEFTIPMFYIIEHLANRRNKSVGTTLNFMNMYPTVKSEYKTFSRMKDYVDVQHDGATMEREDAIFKSKGIDYSSTNSIDLVLQSMYEILNRK